MNYSSPADGPPAAALTVQVVRTIAGVAQLEPDFARLQQVTGNTLPFALFEWQMAWCRHFLRQERVVQDQPLFYVVRKRDGTCIAILPLILTCRRVGRFNFASAALLGADPGLTEIRSPLVQPGHEIAAAQALHTGMAGSREWDWIHWRGPPDVFCTALGRLRSLNWRPVPPSYVLDLPATWEEFRAALKRNIRESLRHGYNSLKRNGHAFTVDVASSRGAVAAALDRLFVLHALRAAMPGKIRHPDRFAGNAVRDFLHDVCAALAQRDIVRVFQLTIRETVVASRIGFEVGDSLYLYYSGFDPEWSKYGVMTTTVAEAVKYAIARGLKTVNLSPGNDPSKSRWSPREVAHQIAYEHNGGFRSRLLHHTYVKAQSRAGFQGWLLNRLIPGRRHWD